MSTRNRTKYSDAFKSTALAFLDMQGGHVQGTAKRLDMPETTLREWTRYHEEQREGTAHTTKLRDIKKRELADALEDFALKGLKAMRDGDDRLRDAPLNQLATAVGISVDKLQLLTGEATERTERVQRGVYGALRGPDVEDAVIIKEDEE